MGSAVTSIVSPAGAVSQLSGVAFQEQIFGASALQTPAQIASALQLLQRSIAKALQPAASLPLLGGTYFPSQLFASGTPVTLAHRIAGGVPVAWIALSRRTSAPSSTQPPQLGTINEVSQNTSQGTITLVANENVLLDLWIFARPGGASSVQQPAYSSPADSGWITALDLDLTAQGNQTLSSDGDYTIGGLTWVKANSANEATHATLASGTGLTFEPVANTAYTPSGANRSLPLLSLTLDQIIPTISLGAPVRLWAYISAINAAADYDNAVAALEWNGGGSGMQSASVQKGYGLSSNIGWGCSLFGAIAQAFDSVDYSHNTGIVQLTAGFPHQMGLTMSGTYSGGWPSEESLVPHHTWTYAANLGAVPMNAAPSTLNLMLGAERAESATSLVVTFARVRVDYRP